MSYCGAAENAEMSSSVTRADEQIQAEALGELLRDRPGLRQGGKKGSVSEQPALISELGTRDPL
jgi:hypothetical protein